MKKFLGLVACAAFAATMAPAAPAAAQGQTVKSLRCDSSVGVRQSCGAGAEIVNASITRLYSEVPCILGYTWGFEENGVWVGNGCRADFDLTVVASEPNVDVGSLQSRLRESRQLIRELRGRLGQEREARQALEAELSEVSAALASAGETKQRKGRKAPVITRSVAACSNKAVRDLENSGATNARVVEIISARLIEGAWMVLGKRNGEINGQRTPGYFRCWTEKGKVVNYENSI